MKTFTAARKRWHVLIQLACLVGIPTSLIGAELRVASTAIERVIISQFFITAHQRHYLSGDENSRCDYAYLESPRVTTRGGQIFVTIGLRARKATEFAGNCIGPGDSRDITFSAVPYFDNGALGLKNINLVAISGLNFPGADTLIRSFIMGNLPSTFLYDFRSDLEKAIATADAPQGLRLSLAAFTARGIQADGKIVVCTFDFAFAVAPR